MEHKVILITGASSGIGQTCAQHLARLGHRVYGTSRRAPFPPGETPSGVPVMIEMDVDCDESVQRAVDWIVQREGRLDVVVNNAGFGIAGAVEETSVEEARAQFETLFFGALRVCRAALPAMRGQGAGLIVNVSSLGGIVPLPYQAMYSAAKFALESLSESLRMEVEPHGVYVSLIEPGDTRTGFTANRRVVRAAADNPASPYAASFARTLKVIESDERGGAPPESVAWLLARIVTRPRPRLRYAVGPLYQKLAAVLKKLLPAGLFNWLLMKYYRVA